MTASPLKNLIDRVPYKPYIRPLSPLAIVHQYHAKDLDTDALMLWPSDGDIQQASVAAFKEAEQLLATVGIKVSSMLARYTPPNLAHKPRTLAILQDRPQTLHELMMLYSNMPMTSSIEDEVETCEMAIAAD